MIKDYQQLTIRMETTEDNKIEQFDIYSGANLYINFVFFTKYLPEDIIFLLVEILISIFLKLQTR